MKQHLTALMMVPAMALMSSTEAHAQTHRPMTSGEIAVGVRRLGVVGNVLYVAAHPDDENTRLLTWLVGARGVRAAYLSLTRGDGGQNLVGAEQDELLGLLRTHELLAARRIDGAEQLFTRMRDFGYSKSAEETLRIWDKEEALSDVVLAIRRFKPDLIITRFNTRPPNHGHHTASALLTHEAFTAAADPARFPQHTAVAGPWSTPRLVHNVSTWNLPKDADVSAYLKLDVGGFEPLLGRAWGEFAAESRTQHKSQGFGVAPERGPLPEYFTPVAGSVPAKDIFEGLDLTWKRFAGTEKIQAAVDEVQKGFDFRAPHKSAAGLVKLHEAISALPNDNTFKAAKLLEVENLLLACTGLFLEARAAEPGVTPGATVGLSYQAINRSPVAVQLVDVTPEQGSSAAAKVVLAEGVPFKATAPYAVSSEAPITTPYWLSSPGVGARYTVADLALLGLPTARPPVNVTWTLDVLGRKIAVTRPVLHAWTDPVRGELYRVLEVVPPVTVTMDQDVVMVPNGKPQQLNVVVEAGRAAVETAVQLDVPAGWKVAPAQHAVKFAARGDQKTVVFTVTPPKDAQQRVAFSAVATVDGKPTSWRQRMVNHDHVPPLTVRQPSSAVLVPFSFAPKVKRVGYIPGPGDRVAQSLSSVGYDVTILPEETLAAEKLERFEVIVVGVRAFNANPRLVAHRDRLNQYVIQGGRLVVQYNTNSRIGPLTVPVGPYPMEIGRDRVTDETAEMTAVNAKDPVLTTPNRLTAEDYLGWVQERGLYFAATWDANYRTIYSIQDAGEKPALGSVLVAKQGKGTFVYTGLAFFRQLPAGVPGAYRLFANLMAQ